MLSVLDGLWKDHLLAMDHLKEGIGLRGYGQQDPLIAYKRESFEMFEAMMTRFQEDTVRFFSACRSLGRTGRKFRYPRASIRNPLSLVEVRRVHLIQDTLRCPARS